MKLPARLTGPAGARRRRPVLTPRALVLGGLVILLIVVLASPLRHYLGSRTDIARAAQQLRDDQSALKRLTAEKARWSDPGYVQEQARMRLMYAMPGDTVYVVADKNKPSLIARTSGAPASSADADGSWNARLWDSVRVAAR